MNHPKLVVTDGFLEKANSATLEKAIRTIDRTLS
jgi:hypothetical protein